MPTKKRDLLNFDRGADWTPEALRLSEQESERRRKEEEERARIEALARRWDNVEGGSGVQTTEVDPPKSSGGPLESLGRFLYGGAGAAMEDIVQNPGSSATALGRDALANTQGVVSGLGALGQRGMESNVFPLAGLANLLTPDSMEAQRAQDAWGTINELRGMESDNRQTAAQARNRVGGFGSTMLEAGGGALSPVAAASMIPGGGVAAAGILGFGQSFGQADAAGLTPRESVGAATWDALGEVAGAKLGNMIPGFNQLAGNTARTAGRLGINTLREAVGEGLTAQWQAQGFNAIEAMDTDDKSKLNQYAAQRSTDIWQQTWMSMLGGGMGGAAMTSPQVMLQYASEQGQFAQQQIAGANAAAANTEALRVAKEAAAKRLREAQETIAKVVAPESSYLNTQIENIIPMRTLQDTMQDVQGGAQAPYLNTSLEQPAPVAQPQVDPEADVPVEDFRKILEARGIAQETNTTETTTTSPQDVWGALALARGERDSNIATTLLSKNKVNIVDSVDQLPEGAKQLNTIGWYDGKTTYVVADKLNRNNIIPELMSTIGHEVKHGVDASGYAHVLGKQANSALIAQAKALAKKGDARAIAAYEDATGGQDFDKELTDREQMELVSYSINNAMDDNTGGWGAIKRTAAAAWRDKARNLKLSKADVKIEDLRYLTKSMLESVALSDQSLEGRLPDDGKGGQAMFAGVKANTANINAMRTAETIIDDEEGRLTPEEARRMTGWFRDTDGQMKFEFSDNEADLMPSWHSMPTSPQDNTGSLLNKVLKHDKLYEAYPWIGKVRITRKPYPFRPTVQGHANYDLREINIAPNVEDPISIILHEVQHLIQARENWAAGGNQNAVLSEMSPEQKLAQVPKLLEPLRKKAQDEAALFNVYDKLSRLPTSILRDYRDTVAVKEGLWIELENAKEEFGDDSMEAAEARQRWYEKSEESQAAFNSLRDRVFGKDGGTMSDYVKLSQASRDWEQLNAVRDTWRDKAMASQQLISKIEAGDIRAIDQVAKETDSLFDFYRRLSGEVQSRTTEKRRHMNDEQRREISPDQTRGDPYVGVEPEDEITILQDGTQLAESEAPAGMAQVARTGKLEPKAPKSRGDFRRVVERLFTSDSGYGQRLNEIKQHMGNQAGAMAHDASIKLYAVDEAIRRAVDITGVSREAVLADMRKAQEDTVPNNNPLADTSDRRKSLISALDRKYKGAELGKALNDLRALKWNMGQEFLRLRLENPNAVDKEEMKVLKSMVENEETWTTRAFESLMPGSEKWAKSYMEAAKKAGSKESAEMEAAAQYLMDNDLSIPDESLDALSNSALERLHKAWDFARPTALKSSDTYRQQMIDDLDFLNEATTDEVKAKAMDIVTDLIQGSEKTNTAAQIRGMKQNRTVITARTRIPEQLRRVMGEVTDPFLREALSVARLTNLVASTRGLTDVYKVGEDSAWSNQKKEGFTNQLPNSASLGPLSGKWVTQDVHDMLGAYTKYADTYDTQLMDLMHDKDAGFKKLALKLSKGVQKVGSAYKMSNIVLNPWRFALNVAGSPATIMKNGAWGNAWEGLRDTVALVYADKTKTADPARLAKNKLILEAGGMDSAMVGSERGKNWELIEKHLNDKNTKGNIPRAWMHIVNKATDAKSGLADIYAVADVWTKVATMYKNRDVITAYAKAEGLSWSENDILRMAGYMANRQTISYAHAPQIVRMAEQHASPLLGFLTYKTEAIRSVFGGFSVASDMLDMAAKAKTPEGKKIAKTQALSTIGGTLAMLTGVLGATAAYLNERDDEEKDKEALFPEFENNRIHWNIGRGEDGTEHYINLNQLDPYGPLTEIIIDMAAATKDGEPIEGIQKALGNFITTFGAYKRTHDLMVDAYNGVQGKEVKGYRPDPVFKKQFPDAYKAVFGENPIARDLMNIAETTVVPAPVITTVDPERMNIPNSKMAVVAKATGVKDTAVNPQKALTFKARDYTTAMKDLQEKAKKAMAIEDPAELSAAIGELNEAELDAFTKMTQAVRGFKTFKQPKNWKGEQKDGNATLTDADARAVLKDAGVNKGSIVPLTTGEFTPRVVNKQLVDNYRKAKIAALDPTSATYAEDKASIDAQIEVFKKLYIEQRDGDK